MHKETLKEIVRELDDKLSRRFLGRLFQLSPFSLAIDFGIREEGYLFISIEPAAPRLYLIKRGLKELEKAAMPLSAFAQALRTSLGGGNVRSVTMDENERVVRLSFSVEDDIGISHQRSLVAQLTGRSANLFLLDADGRIAQAWRIPQGEGQGLGDPYQPPAAQEKAAAHNLESAHSLPLVPEGSLSLSATLDQHYRRLAAEHEFESLAANLAGRLRKEVQRRKKLKTNLASDLSAHGQPDEHKRLGDLLLANIANAKRNGNLVQLTDYYSEGAPTIEIEVDENTTLQQAAGEYFSRYTKAKRAVEGIGARLVQLDQELEQLNERKSQLERAIASGDFETLAGFDDRKVSPSAGRKKQKASLTLPGMRRYRSSDGYEVLVGRTARDNDQLTFRVARPNDLWLHAGDYPGSHVIVRNSGRSEIPHRTIIEAAQLAAKFSQAARDSKVTIHYTRRKFLTKPKGAAPGLVRMSTFKAITVEPGENLERIKTSNNNK
ncbi:MAG TPA: NFACT family protein [Pyrinomonadaceae bacterium]|nr:NFACT family protein [Pyrinomonadaceae bacterium]